jgi:hypothetical protein
VDDQVQLLKRCSDTLTLLEDVRVAPKIITDTQAPTKVTTAAKRAKRGKSGIKS